jgi:hypothetical protein
VQTCLYISGRFEDSVCWNEEATLFKKEYKDRQGNFCLYSTHRVRTVNKSRYF